MKLQAITTGPGVPRSDFQGVVHSTFQHACNLAITGGSLITLLPATTGNLPQGIRLDTPLNFDFKTQVRGGQVIGCRAGVLRIAAAPFAVDMRNAQAWSQDLNSLCIDIEQWPARHAWRSACQELYTWKPAGGFVPRLGTGPLRPGGPGLSYKVRGCIRELLQAARRKQVQEAVCLAACLIGLGPGLTPSGDDFLTGFLAGLWSTAGGDASRRDFVSAFGTHIAGMSQSTTQISRTYLEHAAAGRFSEVLGTLAVRIGQGQAPGPVKVAARAALQVGSTSGADGVVGLLLGLTIWQMMRLPFHLLEAWSGNCSPQSGFSSRGKLTKWSALKK